MGGKTDYGGFPMRGYVRTDLESHWARFTYSVDGKIKAVVVMTDTDLGATGYWRPVGLRRCDPAEFDPASGLTGGLSPVWLDRAGILWR